MEEVNNEHIYSGIFYCRINCMYNNLHMVVVAMNKRMFRHPITTFIDWYIASYYSENYIHRNMIRDEIHRRLQEQEKRLRSEYNLQIEKIKKKYELEYQIKEDGYIAEIMRLEERDDRRERWHKKVMELYYRVRGWAEELAVISATNKHHDKEIFENMAEYIGKHEKSDGSISNVIKEIKDESKNDKEVLEG
jgi:hypothetical protein